ncbi:MAG: trigger factor [Christensenellales bacterium]|jgi:trigger factor
MTKKIIAGIMVLLMALTLFACQSDPGDKIYNWTVEKRVAYLEDQYQNSFDPDEYVTLGSYMNIPVTVPSTQLTDEDISEQIQMILLSYAEETREITDRAVQLWDTVNIDYEGTKDGVPFEGGTAQDAELIIGSGRFIPGFEDGLIGKALGEEIQLNLTFPEDYGTPELNGADVIFKVTINAITQPVPPEYNDEFVQTTQGFDTTEEFEAFLRDYMQSSLDNNALTVLNNTVWDAIVAGSVVRDYPQAEVDAYVGQAEEFYLSEAETQQMTLTQYLETNLDMTEEDFYAVLADMAKEQVGFELIVHSIAKAQNITLTPEEYASGIEEYIAQAGYESDEAFAQQNGEPFEQYYGAMKIWRSLMNDKVTVFVTENADITGNVPMDVNDQLPRE